MNTTKLSIWIRQQEGQNYLANIADKNLKERLVMRAQEIITSNTLLENVNPKSFLNAIVRLELLGLGTENNTAYLVPYGSNLQIIISAQGYMNMIEKTGLYEKIDCVEVKEKDFESYDLSTNKYKWVDTSKWTFQDIKDREKQKTIGWRAFSIDNNGKRKELFWDQEKIDAHHKEYSKAFQSGAKIFKDNKKAMDRKLVLKMFIKHNIAQSLNNNNVVQALKVDSAIIDNQNKINYYDNPKDKAIDYEKLNDPKGVIETKND